MLLPVLAARAWPVVAGDAHDYLWVDVGGPSEPFARRLLEHGIVVAPGSFFGPSGEGYIRFALVPTQEECERAATILRGGAVTTEETIAALDRGEVRVAEPDDDWRVNADVQAAILDYFRLREMEPREVGPFEYHDKIPLKTRLRGARRPRRAARRSRATARSSRAASC